MRRLIQHVEVELILVRVLALSDIHGDVSVVSRLRDRERNIYDLIIVAGDVGTRAAREICDILETFCCPVAFVYGNHDSKLPYDFDLGAHGHHLHDRPLEIEGVRLVGFSGCPSNWGCNPIACRLEAAFVRDAEVRHKAVLEKLESISLKPEFVREMALDKYKKSKAYIRYRIDYNEYRNRILEENRSQIFNELNASLGKRAFNIVVTHEKLTKTASFGSGVCFIHGHNHQASCKKLYNQIHLNVAALDIKKFVSAVNPEPGKPTEGNFQLGNYVSFEITSGKMLNVQKKSFGCDPAGWNPVDGMRFDGAPSVGVDASRDVQEMLSCAF